MTPFRAVLILLTFVLSAFALLLSIAALVRGDTTAGVAWCALSVALGAGARLEAKGIL